MARSRTAHRRGAVLALLLLALLGSVAACASGTGRSGADDDGAGATGGSSADPAPADRVMRPETDLLVQLDRGDGSPRQEYTLFCGGPVESSHPLAQAACDHLAALEDPFAPIAADAVCTEIYGGPQTARVSGQWQGRPVDLELSRIDGCRVAQWDRLGPLLPGPVG